MEALRDTTSRAFMVHVPKKDAAMFRSMTTRMGWTIIPQPRKRKSGLELAMEDVKAGRINRYNSSAELFEKLGI